MALIDTPRPAIDDVLDRTTMGALHHAVRRDLARFQSAVRATPVDDGTTWRALEARWRRFRSALDHHHAAADDHVWAPVRHRIRELQDADGARALRALRAERAEVEAALGACDTAFAAMAAGPGEVRRDVLLALVTTTRATLLSELRNAETQALPLGRRILTSREFAAATRRIARSYPARTIRRHRRDDAFRYA